MRSVWRLSVVALVLVGCVSSAKPRPAAAVAPAPAGAPAPQRPPEALRVPHPVTVHGVTLQDDFAWLRNKDAPEVLGYLKSENTYADAALAPQAALRESLFQEMRARIAEDDDSPPTKEGDFWYLERLEKGKQYPQLLRRRGSATGADEVILDLNALAEGKKFIGLGEKQVSDDGNLLAYSIDETGFRQYELRVRDLRTGKDLAEHLPRADSFTWAGDNQTLLWVEEDPVAKRPSRLYRHRLGEAGPGELVYEEKDERFVLEVARSNDRELVFVHSESHTQSEERWVPARAPQLPLRLIEARRPDLQYSCDHRGSEFWCRSNSSGRNFGLWRGSIAAAGLAVFTEVVPHRPDVIVEGVDVRRDYVVLREREGGLPQLRFLDLRGPQKELFASSHRVAMPESAFTVRPGENREFDGRTFRFVYESPVTPVSWFDYDPLSRTRTLVKERPAPGHDRSRYQVERLSAVAVDGTSIPITLVSLKGRPRDGSAAVHLNGYGAYGIPLAPGFNPAALVAVDHGIDQATAHIRGGGDLGKLWHDNGRMGNKKNSFTDFIAAADYLVNEKIAARERLVISGRSAGGLLMGAVLNLRPDLCKAALLGVPFVDVMNTMLDASLPLTVGEFEEWGNPGASKADFDYMLSYSPYDNIRDVHYPDLLVRTAYNDSQVMYWEPAKYVAKMRAVRHDPGQVLLQTSLEPAGHGGASGRYDRLRERALELAWMLAEVTR